MIVILAMSYAIFMKIADLLDEHGLKWFYGDSIIFGILCGLIGGILIKYDFTIAHGILAMIIGFIIRLRIDYINHSIAFVIIITTFLYNINFDITLYFYFLLSFLIFGIIKDLKYLKEKTNLIKVIDKVYLYIPIVYTFPSLFYSIYTNQWIIFICFFTFDLTYNIVRLISRRF